MLVVPLEKDTIVTTDGETLRVVAYTNYKDGGPAVYARPKGSKVNVLVYFFDIESINKVRVEFQRGSKVFRALGKIDRKYHLPQPDDKATILTKEIDSTDDKYRVEIASLKLKAKSLGNAKGMFFRDTTGKYHRIQQILDIDRSIGSDSFDRSEFLSYYKDYIGA